MTFSSARRGGPEGAESGRGPEGGETIAAKPLPSSTCWKEKVTLNRSLTDGMEIRYVRGPSVSRGLCSKSRHRPDLRLPGTPRSAL